MAFYILTAGCYHCSLVLSCLAACYLCPLIRACHRETVWCGYETNTLRLLTQAVIEIVTGPSAQTGANSFCKIDPQYEITL